MNISPCPLCVPDLLWKVKCGKRRGLGCSFHTPCAWQFTVSNHLPVWALLPLHLIITLESSLGHLSGHIMHADITFTVG